MLHPQHGRLIAGSHHQDRAAHTLLIQALLYELQNLAVAPTYQRDDVDVGFDVLSDYTHQGGFAHAGAGEYADTVALTDGERGISGWNPKCLPLTSFRITISFRSSRFRMISTTCCWASSMSLVHALGMNSRSSRMFSTIRTDMLVNIMIVQTIEDVFLAGLVQVVHDAGHIADAAHLDVGLSGNAGEFPLYLCVDGLDGGGGGTLHGGDGLHHLDLSVGFQLLDDTSCLARAHIGQHQG